MLMVFSTVSLTDGDQTSFTDGYEEFGNCAASEISAVIHVYDEIKLDFLRAGDASGENENGLRGCE